MYLDSTRFAQACNATSKLKLCVLIECSDPTIRKKLKNPATFTLDDFTKICRYLKKDPRDFFTGTETPKG